MAKAWKITHEGGYEYVKYEQPTAAAMEHYAKHNVKVEEIEVKGPVVKLFLAVIDGSDGSHSVQIFPSAEARDKEYPEDDRCFGMGFEVPPEHEDKYVDLSDYKLLT